MKLQPQDMPDRQLISRGITGVIFLLVGIYFEAATQPLEPILYMPGFLLLVIGLGFAVPIGELFVPKGRMLVYLPFVLGIAYVQLQNDLSLLPMCVFLGLYRLTQVGLVLYFRANPV